MSKRIFPAVGTLTVKGAILVAVVRLLCRIVGIFKGRKYRFPIPGFEENPLHYTTRDIVYFAYKYYLHPPEKAEKNSGLESYFHHQTLDFSLTGNEKIVDTVTIHAGGDLMPYEWINKDSAEELWKETGDWFFNADIVIANLETPLDFSEKPGAVPEVMLNDMHFNGSEEMFRIFSGNGKYDVLSTANNHSWDMGKKGLLSTLRFLEAQDIAATGTAARPEDQWNFPIIERKGIKTAFVSATYSLNHLVLPVGEEWMVNTGEFNKEGCDLSLIKKLVQKAKDRGADFIVLSLHTGNAYQAYPGAHTVEIFHRIFRECGPDLILGGHPHNPQPMEKYAYQCPFTGSAREGLAVYSLGDFVAYDIFTWCHLHLCLHLEISRVENNGETYFRLTDLAIDPYFLWAHRENGKYYFRFIPLWKMEDYRDKMSKKNLREVEEIMRFWKEHLGPSMKDKLRIPF